MNLVGSFSCFSRALGFSFALCSWSLLSKVQIPLLPCPCGRKEALSRKEEGLARPDLLIGLPRVGTVKQSTMRPFAEIERFPPFCVTLEFGRVGCLLEIRACS